MKPPWIWWPLEECQQLQHTTMLFCVTFCNPLRRVPVRTSSSCHKFNLTSMMVVIREIVASPTKNRYPMTDPWDERFLYLLIYQRNQPFMYVETGLFTYMKSKKSTIRCRVNIPNSHWSVMGMTNCWIRPPNKGARKKIPADARWTRTSNFQVSDLYIWVISYNVGSRRQI